MIPTVVVSICKGNPSVCHQICNDLYVDQHWKYYCCSVVCRPVGHAAAVLASVDRTRHHLIIIGCKYIETPETVWSEDSDHESTASSLVWPPTQWTQQTFKLYSAGKVYGFLVHWWLGLRLTERDDVTKKCGQQRLCPPAGPATTNITVTLLVSSLAPNPSCVNYKL